MSNSSEETNDIEVMALKQKTLDVGNFLAEIHIGVLQAFDHPSEILAYITACPNAARIWWTSKGRVLKVWIDKTLHPTAIRTGIKILKYMDSGHSLTLRQLGQLGGQANTNTNTMSVERLVGLFKLCCFHELFVRRCMEHTWLAKQMYDVPKDDRPWQTFPAAYGWWDPWPWGVSLSWPGGQLLHRLERPARGGIPLHSRMYSGFFSLELFMRVGGLHQWASGFGGNGIDDLEFSRQDWANLYDVPGTPGGQQCWLWSDVDLAVDMAIVSVYLEYIHDVAKAVEKEPVGEMVSGLRLLTSAGNPPTSI